MYIKLLQNIKLLKTYFELIYWQVCFVDTRLCELSKQVKVQRTISSKNVFLHQYFCNGNKENYFS